MAIEPRDTRIRTTRDGSPRSIAEDEQPQLEAGATVGRYLILDMLGSGGMSVVYGAYDPQLDRRVALKLVRPGGDGRDSQHVRDRLIREAQALARLAHPNVVTVHDVGTLGDQVFVAMEYVEGRTLTEWLGESHSQAELLDVFVHAGEGLAAAHARGLVHRDFKPDNVMIDGQGRVRVMDFGLARPSGSPSSDVVEVGSGVRMSTPSESPVSSDPFVMSLTATGAVMGTPAYMAPEQHAGRCTGPATDQFSFCVALYEALNGLRPFGGVSRSELRANVLHGRMQEVPRTKGVPRGLRQAIERGLAVKPHKRWPSMNDLLAQLRRVPRNRRRRRRALVAGGALGVAGLVALLWPPSLQRVVAPSCTAVTPLSEIWDGARRARLGERFGESARPWARTLWSEVEVVVDQRVAEWTDVRAARCEAEAQPPSSDARGRCLELRRGELAEILEGLEHGDVLQLEHAKEQLVGLPTMHDCEVRWADDESEESTAEDAALRRALTEAQGLVRGQEIDAAVQRTAELRVEADAVEHGPLAAEVWLVRGQALAQAERWSEARVALEQGWERGVAEGHDDTAIASAIGLVRVLGALGEPDDALYWARNAEAFIARGARGPLVRVRLKLAEAVAHGVAGKYDYARSLLQAAVEQRRIVMGDPSPAVAEVLVEQGRLEQAAGRAELALTYYRDAREGLEYSLGPDHPRVATLELYIADVLVGQGSEEVASAALQQAIDAAERAHGASHPAVARALYEAGDRWGSINRSARAYESFDRAEHIVRSALSDQHPLLGRISRFRAGVLMRQHRLAEAERELQLALGRLEAGLGSGHASVADTLDELGRLHRRRGEPERALERHRRAQEIRRTIGAGRLERARSFIGEAHALLDRKQRVEAMVRIDEALASLEGHAPRPELEAEARLLRARALFDEQGDVPDQAMREARTAAALLGAARHVDPRLVEAVAQWIAEHG